VAARPGGGAHMALDPYHLAADPYLREFDAARSANAARPSSDHSHATNTSTSSAPLWTLHHRHDVTMFASTVDPSSAHAWTWSAW
jgi:hypothetical protein